MPRYVEENEIYKLFNVRGVAQLHMGDIDVLPRVEVKEVVHGRWIHTAIEDDNWGGIFHSWTCSNCDFSTSHNPNGTNYCPNCGAKMDEKVEYYKGEE